jgi:hypothetical protein
MPGYSVRRALVVVVLAVACKKPTRPVTESAGPVASASASVKPRPLPILGTAVTAMPCDVGTSAPEGDTAIAAARNVHRAPDNAIYIFADSHDPIRLEPTSEGCGYRVGAPMKLDKEHGWVLEPDGSIAQRPWSDEGAARKCRVQAYDHLRFGKGRLIGTTFYYDSNTFLEKMDLASDTCSVVQPNLKDTNNHGRVSIAGDDLLIRKVESDWKFGRSVILRFNAAGELVKRYGAAEGKGAIDGEPFGCGDGLCIVANASTIDLHDRDGMQVASYNLHKLTNLKGIAIAGIVDVPGKGVYVLVGHGSEKARAELLRLDGVY